MSAQPKDPKLRVLPEPEPKTTPKWTFYTIDQMESIPEPEWLLEGRLMRNSLALLIGVPGACKTFYALDAALELAEYERVIYATGEALPQYKPRIKAWLHTHPDVEIPPENFYLVDGVPQLGDVQEMAEFFLKIEDVLGSNKAPALLIIDTMARATIGLNENDSRDMGEFVAGCDYLRKKFECCILIIHHIGKSLNGSRGSTAIPGAADTEITLQKDGDIVTATCTKQRSAEPFAPQTYALVPALQSVVLEPTDSKLADKEAPENIKANVLRILVELARDTKGATSGALQAAIDLKPYERRKFQGWLREATLAGYVSQESKAKPYTLTKKGLDALPSKFKAKSALEITADDVLM